jgi:2-phosphosulfolactate phosphatase
MNSGASTSLEVLLAPAEFEALAARDLRRTVCVVFDVLRATSSMVTALGNGAAAIIPAAEIAEALQVRQQRPEVLLAGERDGVRILASQTGSVPFDLGNSPREFTREAVAGRTIVMTTTNGTRALRACAKARKVLLGSFLNLGATADFLSKTKPESLLLVCSGTFEQAAAEDALGAGALCDLLWDNYAAGAVADSAFMVRSLYELAKSDLTEALFQTRNGRRLCSRPELREDVPFCGRRNVFNLLAEMTSDGVVGAGPLADTAYKA